MDEKERTHNYLELIHIDKIYPNGVKAVSDFNLSIKQYEFIALVGPSGCGKSTVLRMIAGLEDISSGDLYIDDIYSNNILSKNRDIAFVFQSYALYPHMTVRENIAFGLKMRKVDKATIEKKVEEAAHLLEIEEYLSRKPEALSGGQRQRVALGRAIVRDAKVFLMDEPLSNLDAKLRVQMRSEIVKLHKKIKSTTIYVTHDQTEAMTMADRIVIMNKGVIQQIGTPLDIYDHPKNQFVAKFIGAPSMNILEVVYSNGKLLFPDDKFITINSSLKDAIEKYYNQLNYDEDYFVKKVSAIRNTIETLSKKKKLSDAENVKINELNKNLNQVLKQEQVYKKVKNHQPFEILLGIRPEDLLVSSSKGNLKCEISLVELLGAEYYLHLRYNQRELIVKRNINTYNEKVDNTIFVSFKKDKIHLFDLISDDYLSIDYLQDRN